MHAVGRGEEAASAVVRLLEMNVELRALRKPAHGEGVANATLRAALQAQPTRLSVEVRLAR